METGRQPAPTRSLLWVPPTRPSAAARAATSDAWSAGVGGAAIERYVGAAHGWPAGDVRSCAARPVPRSVRHVGCASCPPVRCLPSGWTIGLRCRPLPQVLTLDRRGRPPYLHQWAHPRPHQELCARAAGPLNCASRERITLPSTVGGDLGNGHPHSASPLFADTEEVTGSNPVAPTTHVLTRGPLATPAARAVRWIRPAEALGWRQSARLRRPRHRLVSGRPGCRAASRPPRP
jgi:hypothetical protein